MTTPSQPDRAEAIGAASQLTDALNGMSGQLVDITKRIDADKKASEARDKTLGRRVWRVVAAVAFDVALSVAVIVIALIASNANTAATTANNRAAAATTKAVAASAASSAQRAASVAGCEQGNLIRSQQRALNLTALALWETLRSPAAPETPQQAKAIAGFKVKLDEANVQRDCQRAYPELAGGKSHTAPAATKTP